MTDRVATRGVSIEPSVAVTAAAPTAPPPVTFGGAGAGSRLRVALMVRIPSLTLICIRQHVDTHMHIQGSTEGREGSVSAIGARGERQTTVDCYASRLTLTSFFATPGTSSNSSNSVALSRTSMFNSVCACFCCCLCGCSPEACACACACA